MNKHLFLAIASGLLASSPALAAEINIISAGAVEPGVVAAADAFRKETGNEVKIKFATAPAIRQRVSGGEAADVVIAPPAVIDELAKAGKLDASGRVPVGRVGVGALVRDGAVKPDVSSADALKRALLDAESVVYNKASTGLYLEKLFERLGVGAEVKAKETRYPDGAAVMEHIIHGKGKEIGFGAMTEIALYRDKGAQFVGPLPGDTQNYTSYAAAPSAAPANGDGAAAFVRFLATRAAKAAFLAKGVE
ncbi:MAG TPA: substrate-binding domain-containing protein [Xanthobacteraceae bacterium]|nr:substrate-binding domain-containing protein [Xanthobacteraceae bacterium]